MKQEERYASAVALAVGVALVLALPGGTALQPGVTTPQATLSSHNNEGHSEGYDNTWAATPDPCVGASNFSWDEDSDNEDVFDFYFKTSKDGSSDTQDRHEGDTAGSHDSGSEAVYSPWSTVDSMSITVYWTERSWWTGDVIGDESATSGDTC